MVYLGSVKIEGGMACWFGFMRLGFSGGFGLWEGSSPDSE